MTTHKDITYKAVRSSLIQEISEYSALIIMFFTTKWWDFSSEKRFEMSAALLFLSITYAHRIIIEFRKTKNADFTSAESKKIALLFGAFCVFLAVVVILIILSNFH